VTEVAAAAIAAEQYHLHHIHSGIGPVAARDGLLGEFMDFASKRPSRAASMGWREFERLVGEAFRRSGFTVTGFGGNGRDGGVDLGLMKNGARFLVHCKHWRKQQVGVTVVRELHGVIAALSANGGYVITGGQFTREAREFAESTAIQLIDGAALDALISSVHSQTAQHRCPKSRSQFIQRGRVRDVAPG